MRYFLGKLIRIYLTGIRIYLNRIYLIRIYLDRIYLNRKTGSGVSRMGESKS